MDGKGNEEEEEISNRISSGNEQRKGDEDDKLNKDIGYEEIDRASDRLKKNKASGKDGIKRVFKKPNKEMERSIHRELK